MEKNDKMWQYDGARWAALAVELASEVIPAIENIKRKHYTDVDIKIKKFYERDKWTISNGKELTNI